jgi:hypothetical protein
MYLGLWFKHLSVLNELSQCWAESYCDEAAEQEMEQVDGN